MKTITTTRTLFVALALTLSIPAFAEGHTITDLGTASASRINNVGQMVSSTGFAGDNNLHAFIYSNCAMTDLVTDAIEATAINDIPTTDWRKHS